MSFPTTIAVISGDLFGGATASHTYELDTATSSSTSKQYELYTSSNTLIGAQYGIEIAQSGSTTVLNANTHSNTGNPFLLSTNLDSAKLASVVLTSSTTYVDLWYSSGTATARINITSSMIFSSGGTSTEEVFVPYAAISGGTFVQSSFPAGDYGLTIIPVISGSYQVFWTVTTQTSSNQHTITGLVDGTYLLSNNVVGLSSPQTLIAVSSTRKKVHCNFW